MSDSDLKEYRFIGAHAESLDGGRPVEPGEFTGPIDPDAPQNRQLIESGQLIEAPDGAAAEAQKRAEDEEAQRAATEAASERRAQGSGQTTIPPAGDGAAGQTSKEGESR